MNGRYIGSFEGKEKGPLLIGIAGMHGNEPAGVDALERIFELLAVEPVINPSFTFKGRIIGLRGNISALQKKVRFQDKDLNRQWFAEKIKEVSEMAAENLSAEDLEIKELHAVILEEITAYNPEELVLLDLHTTGASGGIFSIPADNQWSLDLAVQMHAPVIKGMFSLLKGTLLNYFSEQLSGLKVRAVAFEAGQHQEILSVNRTIAAVINCMRTVGCVNPEQVENRHDKLLIDFSEGLPKVTSLVYRHPVKPEDRFEMLPGFRNFQQIEKGQPLAKDVHCTILSPTDGMILMPLYQTQGEDGFFIIKGTD